MNAAKVNGAKRDSRLIVRCLRSRRPGIAGSCNAHTLLELMVAGGLFSLVVLGVIACHFAGLRYTQFIQPKLLNAQYNRQTMDRLIEEIRSANSIQVGTGTLTSFTAAGPYSSQAGNALCIYPTTNLSSYIYYFHDSSTLKVWRVPQGMTNGTPIAYLVTNHWIFRMEDFSGNLLTNSQNNAVTGVTLQMLRLSAWYRIADATQVRTHITRRNIL